MFEANSCGKISTRLFFSIPLPKYCSVICHLTPIVQKCNRPFSSSENECGSNDISLQFVEFSNVHNCDRSSNAILSNLAYKIV